MKVLVDFTQIPIQKVGVGVYAKEAFVRILMLDSKCDFYYLLQDDDKELEEIFSQYNVKILKVKSSLCRHFFVRILMEQIYIPIICLKYGINLIHSLHYSFPLLALGMKKIVTIHDLTFFIYPNLHILIKRYYFRFFIYMACKYADSIICVSDSTKKDLHKYIHSINAKLYVVPLAANVPKISNESINVVKTKYGIRKQYLLFIGTLEPRKNIVNLIKAYSRLECRSSYQLVIVGKKGWYYNDFFDIVNELSLIDSVIFTGFVSTQEKFALLSHAVIFIYPSVYEGFGLPILEALSLGIPTITSNVSSMPEVAGNAAVLVNPLSIEDISKAIRLLLTTPTILHYFQEEGPKRASLFSWEITATKTLSVYHYFSI